MLRNSRHSINVLQSTLTSTLTAWRGTNLVYAAHQPALRLKLYDMEGCPNCRTVREALTALGLDVEIYPCPQGGKCFRPEAKRWSGKQQFPLLVDPNTSTVLVEPAAIVEYLFATYAGKQPPWTYRLGRLSAVAGGLGSMVRGMRGTIARPAKRAKQLLMLWSFESSPFSRLVRERLTELELAYVLHNLGKEQLADLGPAVMRIRPGPYKPVPGGRRAQVLAQRGRVQVPYLEDPNTGAQLYESETIIAYLEQQYAR